MKKIYPFLIILPFILFFSCEKDEPTVPLPVEPAQEEDTIALRPFKYTAPTSDYGFVNAIWQDSFRWEAGGVAQAQDWHSTHPDDYFTLQFVTAEPFGEFLLKRQDLYLTEIPLRKRGSYRISGSHWDLDDGLVGGSFFTVTDDGDVLEDSYIVDENSPDNELAITEVDTVEQIYWGTFTVSFEISTQGGKRNPDNPDKFKIRNAEFWAKIYE